MIIWNRRKGPTRILRAFGNPLQIFLGRKLTGTVYPVKNVNKSGAEEPNAQGCAFAHPIFQPQARKGQILRTQILTSIK